MNEIQQQDDGELINDNLNSINNVNDFKTINGNFNTIVPS